MVELVLGIAGLTVLISQMGLIFVGLKDVNEKQKQEKEVEAWLEQFNL